LGGIREASRGRGSVAFGVAGKSGQSDVAGKGSETAARATSDGKADEKDKGEEMTEQEKTIADLIEALRTIVNLHDGDNSLVSRRTVMLASMAIEKATGEVA
jgi:hypothetical protein